MKILKYLLFVLLIIFIAGSIYIATQDGDYQIEESRVIPAPVSLLYGEVSDLSTWGKWSYWGSEEEIVVNLSEPSTGETAGFSWENSEMGDGAITTQKLIPNSAIEQQLLMETTFSDIKGTVYWKFEPAEGGTRVTWGIKDDLNFKEKLALNLRDGNLNDLFEPKLQQGLENLEENVKLQMEEYSINVDGVTQHSGGFFLYMTTASHTPEVYIRAQEMIEQVSLYMEENNISSAGKPFILYNQKDERSGTSIFSAAIPTSNQIITPVGSPVLNGFHPAQKAVKVSLRGNTKNAPEAWQEGYQYIEENGLEVNPEAEPFEVFYNNPAVEPNPALWVTEIFIPVL